MIRQPAPKRGAGRLGGGSVASALQRFDVERALIMGVETDLLFPIEQQQELADGLAVNNRPVTFARLPSKSIRTSVAGTAP